MIVTDRQLTQSLVNARLSNGAAFSIVVPKDQSSRRGVYPVFGMALDPYMFSQIDSSDVAFENDGNIKAEFYCHFFTGYDVSETIFTERLPIHQILGQIRYTATTHIEFYYWDRGLGNPSGNGWDAFRECLIPPQVTMEEDLPTRSLRIYRNKSIFPVFKQGEGTIFNVTDTDLIQLNRTNNINRAYAMDGLIHRGYESTLFGRVRLNPTSEVLSQGYFIQELVTRLSYNHSGVFAPSMGGDLGFRMCGNTSSIFDFDKITMPESTRGAISNRAIWDAIAQITQNFDVLNNTTSAATNTVQTMTRRLTNIANRKAAVKNIPKEPEPPAYDQFNREREL